MGAILGALIGRHLAHTEEKYQMAREITLAPIADRIKNPTNPNYTDEELDAALDAGYKNNLIDKHSKPVIDAQMNRLKAMRAQGQVQAAQPKPLGMPNMSPGTAPPVQPQLPPPPPFNPSANASMAGSQPAPGAPQPQDASAIVQRLLPMLLAAKQQQAGGMQGQMQGPPPGVPPIPGTTPPGTGPGTAPGMPGTPPFADGGAGAGPTPPLQGEKPEMRASSDTGTQGFNVPPPAPAAPTAAPAAGGFRPFYYGMDPEEYAARQGRITTLKTRAPLEMQSEVERQQMPLNYQARKQMYSGEKWFQDLPDIFKAQVLTGQTIPGIGAHFSIPGTTESLPGDVDINGDPMTPGTPHVKRTYINGKWIAQVQDVRQTFKDVQGPDGTITRSIVDPYTGKASGPIEGLTSAPTVREITVNNADGTTSKIGVTKTGQVVSQDPRLQGINPAMLPRETNTFRQMDNGDGTFSLVPVTTFRGPVLPGTGGAGAAAPAAIPAGAAGNVPPTGKPTPPATIPYTPGTGGPAAASRIPAARVNGAGTPFGARSIAPGQRITFEQKAQVFDNTMDLVKSVQSRLPILNSLIAAKKIEMQIDPQQGTLKALVNRNVPLTAEEEKLAGDFASLTEHINTLRGPLGAAGFRGPEAFAALQQQRGNLLANPGVTKVVLENTMKALRGQYNALRQGLDKGKPVPQWAVDMAAPASAIDNPPEGTPTHSIPELGSTFNGGKVLKVTPIK